MFDPNYVLLCAIMIAAGGFGAGALAMRLCMLWRGARLKSIPAASPQHMGYNPVPVWGDLAQVSKDNMHVVHSTPWARTIEVTGPCTIEVRRNDRIHLPDGRVFRDATPFDGLLGRIGLSMNLVEILVPGHGYLIADAADGIEFRIELTNPIRFARPLDLERDCLPEDVLALLSPNVDVVKRIDFADGPQTVMVGVGDVLWTVGPLEIDGYGRLRRLQDFRAGNDGPHVYIVEEISETATGTLRSRFSLATSRVYLTPVDYDEAAA